jgi:CRISPR system Cascade subunit CasA
LIHSERKREDDLRKEERALLNKMVDAAGPLQNYWSALESAFHEILREYRLDRDPDDIRCQWLKAVRAALSRAWAQHSTSVSSGDAWAIRALVKAEAPVLRKLIELNTEILKYTPQKETA